MTDLEKRKALCGFCKGRSCNECPLHSPVCRCGCGTHFFTGGHTPCEFDMTEEEINAAYAIAFPESKVEPEPVMTELVEEGPDTLITIAISGECKVSNIEIYFKED